MTTIKNDLSFNAHNPKVVSSNLARATNIPALSSLKNAHFMWAFGFLLLFWRSLRRIHSGLNKLESLLPHSYSVIAQGQRRMLCPAARVCLTPSLTVS